MRWERLVEGEGKIEFAAESACLFNLLVLVRRATKEDGPPRTAADAAHEAECDHRVRCAVVSAPELN